MAKLIHLTRGYVAVVDDDWYEMVSLVKWTAMVSPKGQVYAFRYPQTSRRRRCEFMHKVILGIREGQLGDHTNGNTLDNRECNLRIATPEENSRNACAKRSKAGKYRGAMWCKRSNRWLVRVPINGRIKQLGSYGTEEEAAARYNEFALAAYGEFARINKLMEDL